MDQPIHVLIASDYAIVRAGLRAIVDADEQTEAVGECTLDELAPQVTALRPDVVLLDLPSGEHDALEVLRPLAAEAPEAAVVVLSGDADEARAREVLQAGVRGYLLRDVSPEEVVEAVRAAHQGLTVLHPAISRALLAGPQASTAATGEPLTPRELEVLRLLAQGLPSKTIATRLRISEHTVKFHVGSILGKLGAASRTEAVTLAIRRGLIAV